jgi:EAL domain-containing protein (putative c-di-GMP-specific phosphodiesterase class I)
LVAISKILASYCLNAGDVAARIGSDEFVLLLNDVAVTAEHAKQLLNTLAENLRLRIMAINRIDNFAVNPSCSIGIVQLHHDSSDVDSIMKHADFAMHNAKISGKNSIRFYDKALAKLAQQRIELQAELRQALERKEFVVHYQPQIDVSNNRVCKAEALMRWQPPKRGLIGPEEFIPLLDSSGLIIPVGDWLLQECLRDLKHWRKMGQTHFCLSINASPYQFKNLNFVADISRRLQQYNVPGSAIELEITESVAIDDMHATVNKIQQLRRLGIAIALDDFGTGYSSLSYLKHLPINTIKLDQSFIKDLPGSGYDCAIVKSTMLMAKHLHLSVVAEGVETKDQLAFLKVLGCPIYQGFLFSPAVPEKDMFAFFKHEPGLNQV